LAQAVTTAVEPSSLLMSANGAPAAKRPRTRTEDHLGSSDNVHVEQIKPLIPPACLIDDLPVDPELGFFITEVRRQVSDCVNGNDKRLICIVGPCSIHDVKAAEEYADKLAKMREEFKENLLIVMRVYFEKPRTTIGWKGLINDPTLSGEFHINTGLRTGRKLLLDINKKGLPCAVEFLDVISPQYVADLVVWGAIGARTTESQVHRELASGLSMPIGFKNGTTGATDIARDAILSASQPHRFLGVTKQGLAGIVQTTGNSDCHVVLRGGSETGPNYSAKHIADAKEQLSKVKLTQRLVVDCSHGNSKKIHSNQPLVAQDVADQIRAGCQMIGGVMIESNLVAGAQKLNPGVTEVSTLVYGQSVTDACVDMEDTYKMLKALSDAVAAGRK